MPSTSAPPFRSPTLRRMFTHTPTFAASESSCRLSSPATVALTAGFLIRHILIPLLRTTARVRHQQIVESLANDYNAVSIAQRVIMHCMAIYVSVLSAARELYNEL